MPKIIVTGINTSCLQGSGLSLESLFELENMKFPFKVNVFYNTTGFVFRNPFNLDTVPWNTKLFNYYYTEIKYLI
jgi:hypothetical protein